MRVVIDASVAAKWVLIEDFADAAERLASDGFQRLVPDLFWIEVTSALLKRVRRRELSVAGFNEALAATASWDVVVTSTLLLLDEAIGLALRLEHGLHDCFYLALADREHCPLVTADRRLHDKVERSSLGGLTMWIEDVP